MIQDGVSYFVLGAVSIFSVHLAMFRLVSEGMTRWDSYDVQSDNLPISETEMQGLSLVHNICHAAKVFAFQ